MTSRFVGKGRPATVLLPSPETVKLLVCMGTREYRLTGELIYKLNGQYDPIAGQGLPGCASCTGAQCNECFDMVRRAEEYKESMVRFCDGTRAWAPIPSTQACNKDLAGKGLRERNQCFDYIFTRWRGPSLAVVPAGKRLPKAFAISVREVSIGDWAAYCTLTRRCDTESDRRTHNMPLTNIGFEQARTYAAWLSERTGKRYRLPTAVEWRYAANAERGQSDSPTRRARRTVNCVRSAGTNGERGAQLADTRQGPRNEWGLVHHIDNAREWVIGDNDAALVAGGSYLDDAAACDVDAIEAHSGVADARTGFRVLLEIE